MARKKSVPAKIRATVLARDNYICRACGFGGSANFAFALEADHIIAENNGGKTIEANLQCLCSGCNKAKSDKFDRQFAIRIASQPEMIWAFNQKVVKAAFEAKTESDMSERLRKIK
jgi:5-methylcytosine-specific restriction endonuclease McrA